MTDRELMQQPEALQRIEQGNYDHYDVMKAAAELRRLHEVNAELLSSLRAIAAVAETHKGAYWNTIKDCARISIAKATGEQQ